MIVLVFPRSASSFGCGRADGPAPAKEASRSRTTKGKGGGGSELEDGICCVGYGCDAGGKELGGTRPLGAELELGDGEL